MNSIHAVTSYNSKFIPQNSGESLYLRPFMFASEEGLGINPSNRFRYMVIASPSGACFSSDSFSIYIEREEARAFPHGTGFAKTGGNYAVSLRSAAYAKKLGCFTTLWIDALEKKYIEEMSGMNFFAVIDNRIHTPPISDTILDGITRKSLIVLAKDLGFQVIEEKIELEFLLKTIKSGQCKEVFACGTAAIVSSVDELVEKTGEKYSLKNRDRKVANQLRNELLGIQEGRGLDKHQWIEKVPDWTLD